MDDPAPDSVVAVRSSSGWSIFLAREPTESETYRVERLEATPSYQQGEATAVLDDDRDLTNSICAHLEGLGYEALPFYETADLLSAVRARRYDGFVLDWIVGETSTLELISGIRTEDSSCPIVVLTGQVNAGVVSEADIAEAVSHHHIEFREKPLRLSILSATLGRAFARSEST